MTRRLVATIGLALSMFVAALDTTIVGTAMPTVIANLGGTDMYTWVFAAYMLTFTTSVPIFGKLADLYGQKVLLVASIFIFVAGSALCGGAQNMVQLIVFRGIQGIGGGAIIALAFATLGHLYNPKERPRVQGFTGAVWAIAAIIGPATGGFIVDFLSWRWVFYVNLPVGVIATVFILANLKETREHSRKPVIDYLGAALLTASIFCLLLALLTTSSRGISPGVLGLFAAAAILFVAFIWNENRSPEPIVPLSLFRLRTYAICNLSNFLSGAALFGVTGFIPLYVQGVLRSSATVAGMALTPMSVGWPLGSLIGGFAINRIGYRNIAILGMSAMVAGFYLLTGISIDSTPDAVGRSMFVIGFGMGFLTPSVGAAVQNAVPRAHMGVASSAMPFYRNIGGAVGVTVMGAILNSEMANWTSRLVDSSLVRSLPGLDGVKLLDPQALLQPEISSRLPAAIMSALEQSLSNSMHAVFTIAFFFVVAGLFVAFLVPNSTPARDMDRIAQSERS